MPGRVYVVTGSRAVGSTQAAHVARDVRQRRSLGEAYWITGAQRGVDVVAAEAALVAHPWAMHEVWCPAKPYAHDELMAALRLHRDSVGLAGGRIRVHHCLPGTDYPYRNLCMLQEAYGLQRLGWDVQVLAYPVLPEGDTRSRRSGTWLCTRQARKAGLPVVVVPLWG